MEASKQGRLFISHSCREWEAPIKALAVLVSREGPLPHAWIFSASTHVVEGVSSRLMTLIAVTRVDLNPLPNTLTPLITILEFRILTYDSTDIHHAGCHALGILKFSIDTVNRKTTEAFSLRGRECSSPFLLG